MVIIQIKIKKKINNDLIKYFIKLFKLVPLNTQSERKPPPRSPTQIYTQPISPTQIYSLKPPLIPAPYNSSYYNTTNNLPV